jgi:hypothetical protein
MKEAPYRYLNCWIVSALVAALMVAVSFSTADAQLTWEPTSLINGATENRPFGAVACDPGDPGIVWALTSNLPDPTSSVVEPAQGVFKSTDVGVTWTQVNDAVLTPEVNALDIAISHTNSDVVYIASNVEGVLKTIDGGLTWTAVNNGITHNSQSFPNISWGVLAVAVDPSDHDIVYCGVANANNVDYLAGAGDHPGFYRSTNGGASWSANNSGLPPRYDPIDLFDTVSHTATIASIEVIPQNPNIVVVGMSDHEVNANLFGSKTANTKGRMFFSTNKAVGSWTELSSGLPQVSQGSSSGDLARVSVSQLHLTASHAGQVGLYASHIGAGIQVFLDSAIAKSRSKGVYKYASRSWTRKSSGLPVVTDDLNDNATNAGPVAISPVVSDILLVGISLSDGGDPGSNNSKVYVTVNGGDNWIKNWDGGSMAESPNFGYTESNAGFVAVNADQSAAFSAVIWGDGSGADDGIYRLVP